MEHIILATHNKAKQEMLRWVLGDVCRISVLPNEFFREIHIHEDGSSHIENATKKALAVSMATGELAIGTDGGLLIPALGNNWDSKKTRRFAGKEADDVMRLDCLLELMTPYDGKDREIAWVEAVALAKNEKVLETWQVVGANGLLATNYDPDLIIPDFWVYTVWDFPDLGKKYFELTEEDKLAVSDPWWMIRSEVRQYIQTRLIGG